MNTKVIAGVGVAFLLIVLLGVGVISRKISAPILTSPDISSSAVVTPTTAPTPTIAINKNSNLLEETTKLSPESFTSDYDNLFHEAKSF